MPTQEQLEAIQAPVVGHVVVEATAGSGKTTTIAHRIKFLMDNGVAPDRILVCTFSKSQADDMQLRILNFLHDSYPNISETSLVNGFADGVGQITTIHAAARRMLIYYPNSPYSGLQVAPGWKERSIIEKIVEQLNWQWYDSRTKQYKLVGYQSILLYINAAKNAAVPWTSNELRGFLNSYPLLDGEDIDKLVNVATHYRRELDKSNMWTFADMVYTCENKLKQDENFRAFWHDRFSHIIIDEAQDTNNQAMRIVRLLNPTALFIVGDADQCVVKGTLIATNRGNVPIESIAYTDQVLSGIGQGVTAYKPIQHIFTKKHTGNLVTVTTASGATVTVTADHPMFASFPYLRGAKANGLDQRHFVYVMYRCGYGFRIGRSQNLKQRINSEHADRLWVLAILDNLDDAMLSEAYLAAEIGLPTQVFEERDGMSQEVIDRLYHRLDNFSKGIALLKKQGLSFDYPHMGREQNGNSRINVRLTCGMKGKTKHILQAESSNTDFWEKVQPVLNRWDKHSTLAKQGRRFRVCTNTNPGALEVLADELQTATDCGVTRRYGLWDARDKPYTLMPEKFPAGSLLVGMFVPVLCDGKLVADQIIDISQEYGEVDVYDLGVPSTVNYIAGGICIHNCLYRFNGATPDENLRGGFDTFFGGQRLTMSMNFRSQPNILKRAAMLIRNNYNEDTSRFMKALRPRDGVTEGPDLSFRMFDTPEDEAAFVKNEILSRVAGGEKPGNFMICGRLNAQMAYIELELLQAGIPFVNLGVSSFFNRPVPRMLLNYMKLAVNHGDWTAFEEIHNVASASMVDKNGKHIPTRYLGAKFLERLDHTALDTIEEAARNKYAQDERGWARWKNGVQDLLDTLHELEGFTPQHSAAAILSVVAKLIVDSWIDSEYGLESDSSDGARDDMAIVLAMAEKFTIEQFLLYVNALQATKDVKPENLTDYVLLGTIYRFKGLERPTVFIIGASQLILPHRFSLGFPVPTDGLAVSSTSTVWDERNLTFVGVTRAKDCCIISGVRQWPSIKQELEPSQFIFEMGLIERDHAQETVKEAIEVSA